MVFKHGIISLDSCLSSHVYLVPIDNKYVIVDTGWHFSRKNALKEIASLNINLSDISMILITHCDIDHIGGAYTFYKKIKCPIYASIGEKNNYLKKSKRIIRARLYLLLSKKLNPNKITDLPDNKIGDFEIIKAPGHCYDMQTFKYKDVLFCGDLIQTRKGTIEVCPSKYNLDNDLYIKTLKLFDMKDINLICPGHGKPINAHPAWESFISNLSNKK